MRGIVAQSRERIGHRGGTRTRFARKEVFFEFSKSVVERDRAIGHTDLELPVQCSKFKRVVPFHKLNKTRLLLLDPRGQANEGRCTGIVAV
jgi:hypothetical protein